MVKGKTGISLVRYVKQDDVENFNNLLENEDIDRNIIYQSLIEAIKLNKDGYAKSLTEYMKNKYQSKFIYKLLVEAKKYDAEQVLSLLKYFKQNIDIEMLNNSLIIAVKKEDIRIVQFLMEIETIDINAKDEMGNTGLMIAAENECEQIVRLLLQYSSTSSIIQTDEKEDDNRNILEGFLERRSKKQELFKYKF